MISFFSSLSTAEWVALISSFLGAFFAFLFFILGDNWKQKKQKKEHAIRALNTVREMLFRHMTLFHALKKDQSAIKKRDAISINLQVLYTFPVKIDVLHDISHLEIRNSIYIYAARIELMNQNIQAINRQNALLSDLGRMAMLEGKVGEYENALKASNADFKGIVECNEDFASETDKAMSELLDELGWIIKQSKSNVFKRIYTYLRMRLNVEYKSKTIEKIKKNFRQQ
ncbi:MAG: hypothetical protein KC925_02340 [Candidatus Doudnabacteria bacterium]|nr:hypothetical protein [Candidatus Doudnabacteria bacterium]